MICWTLQKRVSGLLVPSRISLQRTLLLPNMQAYNSSNFLYTSLSLTFPSSFQSLWGRQRSLWFTRVNRTRTRVFILFSEMSSTMSVYFILWCLVLYLLVLGDVGGNIDVQVRDGQIHYICSRRRYWSHRCISLEPSWFSGEYHVGYMLCVLYRLTPLFSEKESMSELVMCMAWLQAKSQAKPSHTGQARPSQKCWPGVGFGLAWTSRKLKPMA